MIVKAKTQNCKIKLQTDNKKKSVSRTTPFPSEGWGTRFNFGGCLVLSQGVEIEVVWAILLCYCHGISSLLERG
jgi:hypothetical protein